MNLLDTDQIRQSTGAQWLTRIDLLEVFPLIDSTNGYLLQKPAPDPGRFRVVLAEYQSAGRGQRGRSWVSPRSTGVCMSLAYTFEKRPANIASLTLASGGAIATIMDELGVEGFGLKWPNDLMCNGAKLGGLLSEVSGNAGVTVVTGIGINVDLAENFSALEQVAGAGQVTDLRTCLGRVPSRNRLSGMLINALCDAFVTFESAGLDAFMEKWSSFDCLRGQRVSVETPEGQLDGIADGIDERGALCLHTPQGREVVVSGSVSLCRDLGSVA